MTSAALPPIPFDPIPLGLVDRDLDAAAAAFGDAFSRTGFAVVSDHGIAPALIERALVATRAVFALPESVKASYVVAGGGGQRGLTPFGIEAAKGAALSDLKEFWHVGRELPHGHRFAGLMPANLWPAVADFRESVTALYAALDGAGLRMLRAIAVHLDLAADVFDEPVREGNSILRLLHYPPVTPGQGAAAIRAGAHEDINVITLLLGAEEAGLQLLGRDNQWHDIAAPPGSLVCNIGDMLERLSGGRLPSTTHRVVNPAPDRAGVARWSTPFFLHFRPDYLIETMPGGPRDWPPITADAFLRERLRDIKLL